MSAPVWFCSPTVAGKVGGPMHLDLACDSGENIGLIYPAEGGDAVTMARGHLIAAAPEMRAALKDMTDVAEKAIVAAGSDAEYAAIRVASARAAIAIAEEDE